jgi:MFS family permease
MAATDSSATDVAVPPIAWKTLACVSLVSFMVSVEITIISLALEDIHGAFPGTSESKLSWIFTTYNIGVAALLLPAGWLADRFGRRKLFVVGVALFGFGSLLPGRSQSADILIFARAVQSIGAAMQFPAGIALLLAAFRVAPAEAWLACEFVGASGS